MAFAAALPWLVTAAGAASTFFGKNKNKNSGNLKDFDLRTPFGSAITSGNDVTLSGRPAQENNLLKTYQQQNQYLSQLPNVGKNAGTLADQQLNKMRTLGDTSGSLADQQLNKMRTLGDTSGLKADQTLRGMPTKYDVNTAFNNPFYGNTLNYLDRATTKRQQRENKLLSNTMNAQNQIGGSYEAYRRFLQDQAFNDERLSNEEKARMEAKGAYDTSLTQGISALEAFRGDQNQQISTGLAELLGYRGDQNQQISTGLAELLGYRGDQSAQLRDVVSKLISVNNTQTGIIEPQLNLLQALLGIQGTPASYQTQGSSNSGKMSIDDMIKLAGMFA